MSGNDLIKPLGLAEQRSRRPRLLAAAAIVFLAGGGALAAYHYLPRFHGPSASAVINAEPAKKPEPAPSGPATLTDITPTQESMPSPSGEVVVHDPDAESEVAIPATSVPAAVTPVPAPRATASQGGLVAFPNPEMIEASSSGPLPRISASGERPLTAYARPAEIPAGAIRIAIVVGGLGVDKDSTANAIASLPGEVTVAFAPYDQTMNADVLAAHAAGHELLLQVPLEPYNYPAIDPGKNTLTTDASDDVNRGRLRWLLGRMTGYVGVVNYLGARFTAEQQAMSPVLRELASRGLLYLDDGSSPRSATEAAAGSAPFLRADLVLDADVAPAAIAAQLDNLVSIAKARGFAIATATAFPETVKDIAAFAEAASDKGIVLVPLSALLNGHS